MNNETFTSAIEAFKTKHGDELTEDHLAIVVTLEYAASKLDNGDKRTTLLALYVNTFRALAKSVQQKQINDDKDDDLLTARF